MKSKPSSRNSSQTEREKSKELQDTSTKSTEDTTTPSSESTNKAQQKPSLWEVDPLFVEDESAYDDPSSVTIW